MKKKSKKNIVTYLIIFAILVSSIYIFTNRRVTTPPELEVLRQQIEINNSGKTFELEDEYIGPNSNQPLPFNYNNRWNSEKFYSVHF